MEHAIGAQPGTELLVGGDLTDGEQLGVLQIFLMEMRIQVVLLILLTLIKSLRVTLTPFISSDFLKIFTGNFDIFTCLAPESQLKVVPSSLFFCSWKILTANLLKLYYKMMVKIYKNS